jgi:recombination protein RecA
MAKKPKEVSEMNDDDTLAFVHELKSELNSKFKYQVAYEMGDDNDLSKVTEFISTGVTLIDYCLGNRRDGGFPVGRISEMHGGEGSGKTLLALMALANTQKRGGIPILIDTERSHNEQFAEVLGLRREKGFLHAKPDTVEDVLTFIENVIAKVRAKSSDKLITIVWDSIAATPVAEELIKDWDPKSSRSPLANMLNLAMKKLLRQI